MTFLLVLAAGLALVYLKTPYTALGPEDMPLSTESNTRYLLPALVALVPAIAWAASKLPSKGRVAVDLLLLLAVADGIRRGFTIPKSLVAKTAVAAGLIAGAGYGLSYAVARIPERARRPAALAAAGLTVLVLVAVGYERQRDFLDERYEQPSEPTLAWIQLNAPRGARVALAGQPSVGGLAPMAPAFGPRFDNEVDYVGDEAQSTLRPIPDEDRWVAAIRDGRYDLVLVGVGGYGPTCEGPGGANAENEWAQRAGFQKVAGGGRLTLWKVEPG